MATKRVPTAEILQRLSQMYPDAKCALHHRDAFELLVATVLSAQCTDARVNIVTGRIFPQYNKPEHFAALTVEQIGEMIKDCGLWQNKAKNIQALSRLLLEKHGGEVPPNLEDLVQLPGVGRKTANVVLSNAFGVPAIAVDTHVFRVSNRLGLASAESVEETEQQLMKRIPRGLWSQAHHWLIHHGRQVCDARKPRCSECPLLDLCKFGQQAQKDAARAVKADARRLARSGVSKAGRTRKRTEIS
ncbi:MAG: endonuclease III [Bacillota bacterium]